MDSKEQEIYDFIKNIYETEGRAVTGEELDKALDDYWAALGNLVFTGYIDLENGVYGRYIVKKREEIITGLSALLLSVTERRE